MTLDGIVSDVILFLEKALYPISVTVFGIVTDVIFFSSNELFPIFNTVLPLIVLGIVTLLGQLPFDESFPL